MCGRSHNASVWLLFLQDKLQRVGVVLGMAGPGGDPAQPLVSSLRGEGALTEFPGTFHRKEAGPAQHRAGFVSPSWWETCLQIPESTHLLPLVTFEHSKCFEVGLPSGSRDFVICHNKQVSSAFWNVPARGHLISSPGVALTGYPARLAPSPLVLSSHSVF